MHKPQISIRTTVSYLDSVFTVSRIFAEEGRVKVELRAEGRVIVLDGEILARFV